MRVLVYRYIYESSAKISLFFPIGRKSRCLEVSGGTIDRCNINLRNWQWVQRKMTNNNWLHHQKITMRMPFTWLRPIIRNCNYFLPVSEWLAFCFCSMSNSSLAIIFFILKSNLNFSARSQVAYLTLISNCYAFNLPRYSSYRHIILAFDILVKQ